MEQLPGFLLAGFALIGSPGPATLSLAAAGATLSRCFRAPRANRIVNVSFAVLLIASVAFLLPFLRRRELCLVRLP